MKALLSTASLRPPHISSRCGHMLVQRGHAYEIIMHMDTSVHRDVTAWNTGKGKEGHAHVLVVGVPEGCRGLWTEKICTRDRQGRVCSDLALICFLNILEFGTDFKVINDFFTVALSYHTMALSLTFHLRF